jgi:hypothetical protein
VLTAAQWEGWLTGPDGSPLRPSPEGSFSVAAA